MATIERNARTDRTDSKDRRGSPDGIGQNRHPLALGLVDKLRGLDSPDRIRKPFGQIDCRGTRCRADGLKLLTRNLLNDGGTGKDVTDLVALAVDHIDRKAGKIGTRRQRNGEDAVLVDNHVAHHVAGAVDHTHGDAGLGRAAQNSRPRIVRAKDRHRDGSGDCRVRRLLLGRWHGVGRILGIVERALSADGATSVGIEVIGVRGGRTGVGNLGLGV